MRKLPLFILMVLFSQSAWATTYCTDASIGACYLLNDASGNIVDSSGNGYTGNAGGGSATYSVTGTGIIGTALSFSGSPFFRTFTASILKPATLPITIVARINQGANGYEQTIWGNEGEVNSGGNFSGAWMAINSAGNVICGFGDNTSSSSTGEQIKTSVTSLSTGTLYKVGCVISAASNITIYINNVDNGGTYSGSGGAMAYRGGGGDDPHMAASAFGAEQYNGVLDEVAQFNRALNVTDITNIAVSGLQSNETAPISTLIVGGKVIMGGKVKL